MDIDVGEVKIKVNREFLEDYRKYRLDLALTPEGESHHLHAEFDILELIMNKNNTSIHKLLKMLEDGSAGVKFTSLILSTQKIMDYTVYGLDFEQDDFLDGTLS